jgi:hypothetical protein
MPIKKRTTIPVIDDSVPAGTDFIGGAEPLPAKHAAAGQALPGSDFAGGTVPLTAQNERGEPDEKRAA